MLCKSFSVRLIIKYITKQNVSNVPNVVLGNM